MDWTLTFKNLRYPEQPPGMQTFSNKDEFVSQAKAVIADLWLELLSATDHNGNVLTADDVRRLVAVHRTGDQAHHRPPRLYATLPPPSRLAERSRQAQPASKATITSL